MAEQLEEWRLCPHRKPHEDIGIRIVGDDGRVSNFICTFNGSGIRMGHEDDPWPASQRERADLILSAPRLQSINAELVERLQNSQADLELLRQAILSNDPQKELILRVKDMKRWNAAALTRAERDKP